MADFIDTLEAMGQSEDTKIAHVAPGEIVIPREIQDEEPQVVQSFIKAMSKAGMNWRQFVVGSPEGNINEETGLQEFVFSGSIRREPLGPPIGRISPISRTASTATISGQGGLTSRQERARIATFALFGGEEPDVERFQSLSRGTPGDQLLPIEKAFLERFGLPQTFNTGAISDQFQSLFGGGLRSGGESLSGF